jgi:predicted  nucleic acid-binding Zn-ribbon protein
LNRHLTELIELSHNDKAIDAYTPKLERADKKLAKVEKRLKSATREREKLSNEVEENKVKIETFNEQLKVLHEQLLLNAKKSHEVKTDKEIKALSLEEDIAKEKMSFANDEIERLEEINEKQDGLLKEASERVDSIQVEFDEVAQKVNEEKALIEAEKEKLFVKRQEMSRKIEQKVLAFYEKIRIWAGNTAVVPVRKQACYGCYMRLNDKSYSEVIRANEICNCPHCGRILYIEPMGEEE